jgi:hypothetical protein
MSAQTPPSNSNCVSPKFLYDTIKRLRELSISLSFFNHPLYPLQKAFPPGIHQPSDEDQDE